MSVKNHNFRFNLDRAEDRKAWETLHSERGERDFKSQNCFVIRAVNDYYERHLRVHEPDNEPEENELLDFGLFD